MNFFRLAITMLGIFMAYTNAIGQENTNNKTLSPYFFIKNSTSSTDLMPLKSTSVNANIAGVIADVTVNQLYVNTGKTTLEAIYVFPASTRAAVYGMTMKVANRILTAKIKEKKVARRDYEKAKKEGKTASLLEEDRPNVFTMNVGNIRPGDTISLELKYTELVIPENGIYEFVYPTVVGPRYSNKDAATATSGDKWVESPYLKEGEKPNYTYNAEVSINAGLAISKLSCPSHKADVGFNSPTSGKLILDKSEEFGGNRDLIVRYQLKGGKIESGLLLNEGEKENFFLLMVQPPEKITIDDVPQREYIFVVDVSGSMHGYPLNISKKLMMQLGSTLRPQDKFNIVTFASGSALFSNQMTEGTQENIDKAMAFIDNFSGSGGTEIVSALEKAVAIPKQGNSSRSIVLLTDGYVDVEQECFQLIKNNLNNANFFAFGIGTSVNRLLIEGIANVGLGEPFVATTEEEAASVTNKFKEYISSPVATSIKVSYEGFSAYDVEPNYLPDLLSDRPLIIYGKYKGKAEGKITITANTTSGKFEQTLSPSQQPNKKNNALKYIWARKRIQYLSDYAMPAEANTDSLNTTEAKVTQLGLQYNLLTRYTSFVAIDSVARSIDDNGVMVKQPLPLAKGVPNSAVGLTNTTNGYVTVEEATEYTEEETSSVYEEEVFFIVEEMASFQGGGIESFRDFIMKQLIYPEDAMKNGIQGKVYISFSVNEQGNIVDIKIVRGIDPILDNEALRVMIKVAKEQKWTPGKQRGKPIRTSFTIPITFNLK